MSDIAENTEGEQTIEEARLEVGGNAMSENIVKDSNEDLHTSGDQPHLSESASQRNLDVRSAPEDASPQEKDPVPNSMTVGPTETTIPDAKEHSKTAPVQSQIDKDNTGNQINSLPPEFSPPDNIEDLEMYIPQAPHEDKMHIRLIDAVGRKFRFPYSLCSTWAVSTFIYQLIL
jgi:hypothetical protein